MIRRCFCGRWPKTLAGILAFLPCAPAAFGSAPRPSGGAPPHPAGQREKKAWRRCDRAGRWDEDDYTQCPYASELTRVLHELTQVSTNITSNTFIQSLISGFIMMSDMLTFKYLQTNSGCY